MGSTDFGRERVLGDEKGGALPACRWKAPPHPTYPYPTHTKITTLHNPR